jgi:hypothetical protein
MKTLYETVMQQVVAGMCQEDFQGNPSAEVDVLNSMTNEQLLERISWALEEMK